MNPETLLNDLLALANPENELQIRQVQKSFETLIEGDIYGFDPGLLTEVEQKAAGIPRKDILRGIFARVTKDVFGSSHKEKWYAVYRYLSLAFRHHPVTQPMYPDKTMVMDPLILLLLGEGRCGHVARVVTDLALANGYDARLVQLATHYVSEVRWDNKWHCIDADADFPIRQMKDNLKGFPSVAELSLNPYVLDKIAARAFRWGRHYYRTLAGQLLSYALWYPGMMLMSSIYFAEEVFRNSFSGDRSKPRKGIAYYYKKGDFNKWQNDRYYGWRDYSIETQKIPFVPLEYDLERLSVVVPTIVYQKRGKAAFPLRFLPASVPKFNPANVMDCYPEHEGIEYEVRVSGSSRGWDYDYRNYRYMPEYGSGDVRILRDVKKYDGGVLGCDIELDIAGDIFVEVIARYETYKERGTFAWPGNEGYVRVFPEKFEPWNYGKGNEKGE
ncbi:MAG: hypothetical protein GY757_28035 [bacterium]|nr:hypothetical protein [bacterium]